MHGRDARRVPALQFVLGDALQPAMHHAADVARGLAHPGIFDVVLGARGFAGRGPGERGRRFGQDPGGGEAAQRLVGHGFALPRPRWSPAAQPPRQRVETRPTPPARAWPAGCARRERAPFAPRPRAQQPRFAEQMQALLRARGGDVEQAAVFVRRFFGGELFDPGVDRIAVRAGFFDRREQQLRARSRSARDRRIRLRRAFHPQEQFLAFGRRPLAQAGHDHVIELQALRLVDGHDLHRVLAGGQVGQRVELVQALLERLEVGDGAGVLLGFEMVEVGLGVFELGRGCGAGRAAEREPAAFDRIAQGRALARGERGREHSAHAREARAAVGRKRGKARRVVQQFPHGRLAGERLWERVSGLLC